ncbi:uncharacterized protein LOC114223276 [Eumetopias jubatus]|uniref:uncharacterized protein LOC114223276 n=1 Tax=Eumetopias jubatus TaxID=34886 RepID=UPI001016C61F|nr:uncharacterized protein LOC114223276 [Eumetopias jubatus]
MGQSWGVGDERAGSPTIQPTPSSECLLKPLAARAEGSEFGSPPPPAPGAWGAQSRARGRGQRGRGVGGVGTRRAAARASGSPAPLSTCPYRAPEAAGAPEGRRAWARGPAFWVRAALAPNAGRDAGGMGGGPAAAAAAAAGRERGGGAARGRGAAAEEEEPGPPQPLTATGVNKQRRRAPAAAPARAGARAQAEPCPWSRAAPRTARRASPPPRGSVCGGPRWGRDGERIPEAPGAPASPPAAGGRRRRLAHSAAGEGRNGRSPGGGDYSPARPRPRPHTWATETQSRRPSSPHSPALLGPMPPPVSPGPQAVSRHVGTEAL